MDLMIKTDILIKLLDYLWNNDSFLFAIAIIVFIIWTIYKNGLRLGKIQLLPPHSNSHNPSNKYYDNYISHIAHNTITEDNLDLGYIVPPRYVYVYGKLWSTTKHSDLYFKLERDWQDIDIIDIRETNITSILISIIEDKALRLQKLTIIHTSDQTTALSYLKKYVNIVFREV